MLTDMKLPPLPKPVEMDDARWGYTADCMRDYAEDAYNAVLAADRAKSGEPVAWFAGEHGNRRQVSQFVDGAYPVYLQAKSEPAMPGLSELVAEAKALCDIDYCFGEADRQAKERRAWVLISKLSRAATPTPSTL